MRRGWTVAVIASAGLGLAGCAAADKHTTADSMGGMSMTTSGHSGAGAGGISGSNSPTGGGAMSMNMRTTTVLDSKGLATPVPIRTIGSGIWKDMRITAQMTTPVPFYVDNGTSDREIKPTPQTSFHLMVMLSNTHTGTAIPYATVWAVIRKAGKIVFNEQQWQMIAEWMGPHYGNDVTLPGPGTYQLQVQVSPPDAAMPAAYANMWNGRHTLTRTFSWRGNGSSS